MKNTLLTGAKRIGIGDLVMVCYPVNEQTNNPAHVLDGQEFVVKSKRKANCNKGGDIYLYELFGAMSDLGVPYSFLTDELIRL